MSLNVIKEAIANQKMRCPKCKKPVSKFDNYVAMLDTAYDGPDSSLALDSSGPSKVTLICGNAPCNWKERTEYWENYLEE
jgi:hypothetical protein